MSEQAGKSEETPDKNPVDSDNARNNQENEIEAEQESAAAMDADVPQPENVDESKPGQSD